VLTNMAIKIKPINHFGGDFSKLRVPTNMVKNQIGNPKKPRNWQFSPNFYSKTFQI